MNQGGQIASIIKPQPWGGNYTFASSCSHDASDQYEKRDESQQYPANDFFFNLLPVRRVRQYRGIKTNQMSHARPSKTLRRSKVGRLYLFLHSKIGIAITQTPTSPKAQQLRPQYQNINYQKASNVKADRKIMTAHFFFRELKTVHRMLGVVARKNQKK